MTDAVEVPALFLDIDGVLNSTKWMMSNGWSDMQELDRAFDPAAIALVNKIVERTACRLVLSSTRRLVAPLDEINKIMQRKGFLHVITDKTANYYPPGVIGRYEIPRGFEVHMWLLQNRFRGVYACVDDDCDFLMYQPLVRTDAQVGIQPEHAELLIQLLNVKPGTR